MKEKIKNILLMWFDEDQYTDVIVDDIIKVTAFNELLESCKAYNKSFKSTIGYQKYDTNVFNLLNERCIQAKKAIEKAELN